MATTDSLRLKFRAKDSRLGVTRNTVRALASELDISETLVVHLATFAVGLGGAPRLRAGRWAADRQATRSASQGRGPRAASRRADQQVELVLMA